MKGHRFNRSSFVFCVAFGIFVLFNANPTLAVESQPPVIIDSIPLPVRGGGVTISSTADRLLALVADLDDDQLIPVDLETHIVLESISFGLNGTNVVPNISTTLDGQLAVAPVYDFSSGFFGIGVVDVKSLSPVGEIIPEPGFPRGVSITPDGSRALVVKPNVGLHYDYRSPSFSACCLWANHTSQPARASRDRHPPDGQNCGHIRTPASVVYIIDRYTLKR